MTTRKITAAWLRYSTAFLFIVLRNSRPAQEDLTKKLSGLKTSSSAATSKPESYTLPLCTDRLTTPPTCSVLRIESKIFRPNGNASDDIDEVYHMYMINGSVKMTQEERDSTVETVIPTLTRTAVRT